ncbi:hypothetical protein COLO4_25350 [Corchorus olitorius]|uniref:Endonuclease/exonuclease/phosphatase n=1 Tax=Corchorus olitorius TaxID=93759 RepID=A0A1R3I3C0_9ROSI|nr:hypothetical protein COLO4_25350 [Corchorus olitorius]
MDIISTRAIEPERVYTFETFHTESDHSYERQLEKSVKETALAASIEMVWRRTVEERQEERLDHLQMSAQMRGLSVSHQSPHFDFNPDQTHLKNQRTCSSFSQPRGRTKEIKFNSDHKSWLKVPPPPQSQEEALKRQKKQQSFPMMTILVWNYRGVRNPEFLRDARDLIRFHNPDTLIVTETKARISEAQQVVGRLPFDRWLDAETIGYKGGIWMLWHSQTIEVEEVGKTE